MIEIVELHHHLHLRERQSTSIFVPILIKAQRDP